MSQDKRLVITNIAVLIATTLCVLGLAAMLGASWVCVVGLGPMLGFTWTAAK